MQENMMNQVKLNFFPTAKFPLTHICNLLYLAKHTIYVALYMVLHYQNLPLFEIL